MEVCWAEKKILFYFSDVISRKKKYFSDESCKHEKKMKKVGPRSLNYLSLKKQNSQIEVYKIKI